MKKFAYWRKQFEPPLLPNTFIQRKKIHYALEELPEKKMVYFCAPAGYGKTVGLQAWLTKHSYKSIWITFKDTDNSPSAFFKLIASVISALQPKNPDCLRILAEGDFIREPLKQTVELTTFLTPMKKKIALVLDQMELIEDPTILRDLQLLTQHLPEVFSLFILTREPLQNTHFIERGGFQRAVVVDREDLLFTLEEVKELFQANPDGQPLSNENAQLLFQATKGWPAGVVEFLHQGTECDLNASFFHYLEEKIWPNWSTVEQNLLIATAITPTVTNELARLLTKDADAPRQLARLAKKTIFITEQKQGVYCYHKLLRQFLATKSPNQKATKIRYQLATAYYLAEGEITNARNFALKSRDEDLILVTNYAVSPEEKDLSISELMENFDPFLELEEELLQSNPYPFLLSQYAGHYFLAGDMDKTLQFLDLMYQSYPLIKENYPQFMTDAVLMSFIDPRKNCFQIVKNFLKNSTGLEIQQRMGWSSMTMHLPYFHRSSRNFLELAGLSRINWPLKLVSETFHKEASLIIALLQAGFLSERGEFSKALKLLEKNSYAIQAETKNELIFCFKMLRSKLLLQTNQQDLLQAALRNLEIFLDQPNNHIFKANYDAFLTEISLLRGERSAARNFLHLYYRGHEELPAYQLAQHFTSARCLLALNREAEATALLLRLKSLCDQANRPTDSAAAEVLLTLLTWRHQKGHALRQLEELLEELSTYGFTQLIAIEGKSYLPLLKKYQLLVLNNKKKSNISQKYLTTLIEQTKTQAQYFHGLSEFFAPAKSALSKRQKHILSLVRQRQKQREIAEALGISLATVKFHLNAAYRKLGVTGAKAALKICEDQGLLD